MGKFYGSIGYAESIETAPGVWEEKIIKKNYYGDTIKLSRRLLTSEHLNDNITVNHQISIVADPYAYENFHSMRYIRWMGASWKITNIDVQRPRLILTIGGLYNG